MKNFILLILSFVYVSVQAQNNIVCIYGLPPAPAKYGICKMNPLTGNISVLDTLETSQFDVWNGTAVDSLLGQFFLVINDSQNIYLVDIDISTGKIVDTLFELDSVVHYSPNRYVSASMDGVTIDPDEHTVYFLYSNNEAYRHLMKSNYITGNTEELFVFDPIFNSIEDQFLDCEHQKYFVIRFNCIDDYSFYDIGTYDLISQDFSSVTLNVDNAAMKTFLLSYNPLDGMLYGAERELTLSPVSNLRMLKADPATGEVEYLTPANSLNIIETILDPWAQRISFTGQNTNPGNIFWFNYELGSSDIQPGEPIEPINGNAQSFLMLLTLFDERNMINFTSSNFCETYPTYFTANNASFNLEWYFDDPASELENYSTSPDPSHIFSHAGTYNVMLISNDCVIYDTVWHQVTIESFPHINLGNDTTLCNNIVNGSIELHVSIENAQYLWQDQSSLSSFEVFQPGIYWIQTTSSCGVASDTINVESNYCPCGLQLFPDLTQNSVAVHIECPLENYSHPHLQLFDALGRKYFDFVVKETDFKIDLRSLPSGLSIYRFVDDQSVRQTGKIVVVH